MFASVSDTNDERVMPGDQHWTHYLLSASASTWLIIAPMPSKMSCRLASHMNAGVVTTFSDVSTITSWLQQLLTTIQLSASTKNERSKPAWKQCFLYSFKVVLLSTNSYASKLVHINMYHTLLETIPLSKAQHVNVAYQFKFGYNLAQ